MQVKFINQSKICLIVSLACFILCIIYLPTKIVISVFTFRRDLLLHQPNYIYNVCSDAAPGFWLKGPSNKISYMIPLFLSVLQWSRQNSVREGGDIQQKCTHRRLKKNFEKFIKNIAQKFNKFSKIFQR